MLFEFSSDRISKLRTNKSHQIWSINFFPRIMNGSWLWAWADIIRLSSINIPNWVPNIQLVPGKKTIKMASWKWCERNESNWNGWNYTLWFIALCHVSLFPPTASLKCHNSETIFRVLKYLSGVFEKGAIIIFTFFVVDRICARRNESALFWQHKNYLKCL